MLKMALFSPRYGTANLSQSSKSNINSKRAPGPYHMNTSESRKEFVPKHSADKVNINSSWVVGISEMRDVLSLACILQLLGLQSNDIDIALTDMMGLAFAEKFQEYCNSLEDVPIEKIAKVEKNPDRSKHLETAKAKVLDIELDFVNLRSEEYAEDSRIPTQVVSCIP